MGKELNVSELESLDKGALIAIIKHLVERVNALEARLSKNSSNSSKPPSSDYHPPRKPKSLRKGTNKKAGGQKGHKGKTLALSQHPNKTHRNKVSNCDKCHHTLSGVEAEIEKRQVYDIPKITIEITEYQIERKTCPSCAHQTLGQFPQGVTHKTQYGKNIQGLSVYMNQYQMVPFKRIKEFFADVFGHNINEGSLVTMNKRCYESLQGFEDEVKRQLCNGAVAHFDESGMRVGKKRYWIHVASTSLLTLFKIHEKRGQVAMNAMGIINDFKGYAVHDYWKPYLSYECFHVLCNTHHLRDLTFIYEQYKQSWPKKMIQLLLAAKRLVDYAKTREQISLPPQLIEKIQQKYASILSQALEEIDVLPKPLQNGKRGRKKKHPAFNLYQRFEENQANILTFVTNFSVPFDNNQAERDIRMAKLKQKISGTFRSHEGADYFARIRSYINTARKNTINVADALHMAFNGTPFIPNTS